MADPLRLILRNLLLGVSVAAPIGPAGLAVIQAGLRGGFTRALLTAVGITLADATFLLLVFFGLANVAERPPVRVVLWVAGAAALLYLGLRSLRESIGGIELAEGGGAVGRNPLLVGYAVNIANPLAIVWWVGIFGSLLAEGAERSTSLARFAESSVILIGILSWHAFIALLSHGGRRLDRRLLRVATGTAGVALILFGLRFALLAVQAIASAYIGG